jgi:hypothetical protein
VARRIVDRHVLRPIKWTKVLVEERSVMASDEWLAASAASQAES